MADIAPLRALLPTEPLADVVSPPYDVIDADLREQLAARSPHNAVHVDLPEHEDYDGAAKRLHEWIAQGAVRRDDEPAIWALRQDYTGPDGRSLTRQGFLCRVKVTDYGPGTIRPHERTHPGPKEDRLRLTRATKANLSPIFSLFSDPEQAAWSAIAPHTESEPFGTVTDDEDTTHTLWRIADPATIDAVVEALRGKELLIADGHHRYETARAYAEELGGTDGEHGWVLMALVALQDPGLTVFPTHRLVKDTTHEQQQALRATLTQDFAFEQADELEPGGWDDIDGTPLTFGYIDAHHKTPYRVALNDQATADHALADMPEPYRRLDAAVLEKLLLTGPLELTTDDISHLHRFGYARTAEQARELVETGQFDLAFVLRPTPVEQVREVAEAGVSMPPKSTYFFPKLLTGMVFSPLDDQEYDQ